MPLHLCRRRMLTLDRCCVTTTLRECNDRGYQCCILEDCTAGYDSDQVSTSLDIVAGQDGLFGFVGKSSDFFAAATEAFTSLTPPSTPPILGHEGLPPIDELISRYKKGLITPPDIANLVYDRIEEYEQQGSAVWIHLESRAACLTAAEKLASRYAGKPLPPLYGVPFSVKDTIDVAGIPTTAACAQYEYTPTSNAPAVQHVLDAGGLFIGKVNLDQLATGLSGCRSPYGLPHSVFSSRHISGGSSSGSAVSVGAGLVSVGLATDTAGSGRVPAAYNGIVGFKPTKGTVSARGLVPACRTLDTISVMAKTTPEIRKVWQIIARHDPDDPFSKLPRSLATWSIDFRGPRHGGFAFAIPPPRALDACRKEYIDLFARAVQVIRSCGGRLLEKELDYTIFEQAGDLLYDASLLHERMTCIGLDFLKTNLSSLHPVPRELFSRALDSPPTALDVFRDQALQIQLTRRVQQTFDTLQGGIVVLVVPTTTTHPTIEEMTGDPLKLNSQHGTFTHFAIVVDLCGAAIPAGAGGGGGGAAGPGGGAGGGGGGFDAKVLSISTVIQEAFAATKR